MHPASVSATLRSARDILRERCRSRLVALFGPQHGIAGEKQDNMIESAHGVDEETGIPIFSLYSETRTPTPEMLSRIDTLVVDLQDVGTRVYTFEWTTALALEACARVGVKVVILDRPNPLGGLITEGNLVRPAMKSFVGLYPVPMRHGLTLGEMASLVNERLRSHARRVAADLTVVRVSGWRRRMLFDETGLPWVLPSPNMPSVSTAMVYPGQVLLEGTNLSEGRGTTRPFEIWGAPWLDTRKFLRRFERRGLRGVVLREHAFEPTFHKYAGELCRGFQIHVTGARSYRPYFTTLAILQDVIAVHPDRFEWRKEPYEYVKDRLPIDVLTGDPAVRIALEKGRSLTQLEESWIPDLRAYRKEARACMLYEA
ncbi:MAG TPA: DUF1343 domain-containing protein, partial [Candidatus Saccharimonadales bacterium]|nr:DUF1343 domain-containing protein [Candidatus Saccharimonadales bacterium]